MDGLTESGTALRDDLSQRYGISAEAVRTLMDAVARGGGQQAQFSHPELGGMGQWSAGGMTMVGDMFNSSLQALVAGLCADISAAMAQETLFKPVLHRGRPGDPARTGSQSQTQYQGGPSLRFLGHGAAQWWPESLGRPSSTGSQNDLHYAIFPESRRLAINLGGDVTVYDTGELLIGGVSQQQSGDSSWTFTSQRGTVHLDELPIAHEQSQEKEPAAHLPQSVEPAPAEPPRPAEKPVKQPSAQVMSADEILTALERLGTLRDKGILDEAEFAAKKADLLSRL